MLTFTTAPNTLHGPCTHALWNGKSITARHHIHMPDGEAKWKEDVTKVFSQPQAAGIANSINAANALLAAKVKAGGRSYDDDSRMAVLSLSEDQNALKRLAVSVGVGGVFG